MSNAIADRFDLGPIDQVAYVVEDLDQSLPRYEALFGAFELMDAPMTGCFFRGSDVACSLRIALNHSGPIEIELIQVLEGKTPHSEHLEQYGEGLHHVRFLVEDLDRKQAELEAAGYKAVFGKRFGPDLAFAYIETPKELGPSMIELFENTGSSGG